MGVWRGLNLYNLKRSGLEFMPNAWEARGLMEAVMAEYGERVGYLSVIDLDERGFAVTWQCSADEDGA